MSREPEIFVFFHFQNHVWLKLPLPFLEVLYSTQLFSAAPSAYWDRIWSLVGVIKLDIWSGRVVIGNRLLPYMLVISLENMNSKSFLVRPCERFL